MADISWMITVQHGIGVLFIAGCFAIVLGRISEILDKLILLDAAIKELKGDKEADHA